MNRPKLEDFKLASSDKLRFSDTDRQGHVNNVAFATFLETGRVELADNIGLLAGQPGRSIVIARIRIDYVKEIFWPGTVFCGTAVIAVGNSSVTLTQALFQNGVCVATAESVVVQVDAVTRRSTPFSDVMRTAMEKLKLDQPLER